MADIVTKEQRSKNMSAIKNKDTKPEVFIRKLLFAQGFRYRKNVNYVPGHPDIYLAKYKTAIFVHGCFWHRHQNCKIAYMPKSNLDFWSKKFDANVARDTAVKSELAENGYRQLIIWECTVRQMKRSEEAKKHKVKEIEDFLRGNAHYSEL